MTDEEQSGRGPSGAGEAPDPGSPSSGEVDPESALRSLERLEALARGEAPPPPTPVRPAPAPDRKRLRVAASPRPAQTWARIAAPIAFLVAVIVVVSLAFQSGVAGCDGEKPAPAASKTSTRSPKPTGSPKATGSARPTTTASPGAARTYKVKAGDTLSGIAAKFDVSVAEIEGANPDKDLTTLQPGQKLKIPPA